MEISELKKHIETQNIKIDEYEEQSNRYRDRITRNEEEFQEFQSEKEVEIQEL